jgi:uncharacterized protein YceK
MKLTILAAVAALGIALSGCATVIKGTTQSVAITTPPTEGATCTLSSKEGSWQVTSPAVARVEKSKEDIQVSCQKPGWQTATATIPSNFQGWTLGNLLIPGAIIGFGVDAATGAMNEYPGAFQVPMQPDPNAARPAPTALKPDAKPTS